MAEEAKPKRPAPTHPKFMDMVMEAVQEIADKKGASVGAIKTYILEKHTTVDPSRMKAQLKRALEKGLDEGLLLRPKSSEDAKGMTGRFKVDKAKIAAIQKAKEKKAVKKAKESEKPAKKKTTTAAKKSTTAAKKTTKTSEISTPKKRSSSTSSNKSESSTSKKTKKAPAKRKAKSPGKKDTKSKVTPKPKQKALPKQTPSKAKLTKKRT